MESDGLSIVSDSEYQFDETVVARTKKQILLLPQNWGDDDAEPVYANTSTSVLKLLQRENVAADSLTAMSANTLLKENRSVDWIAPTLLISSMLVSQDPALVALALNVLGNYITILFRGVSPSPSIKLSIVQTEANGRVTRKLDYTGPATGLSDIVQVLKGSVQKR